MLTSLNISLWRSLLRDYSDVAVCDFLEFGWPIGYYYSRGLLPSADFRNHSGALDYPSAVDSYLSSELEFGSVFRNLTRTSAVLFSILASQPGRQLMTGFLNTSIWVNR